ncbi:MAG: hypothetical protein KF697_00570 [Pseudolabrys sp.]|nr:hypothetical protein [Pseudolabrys sp.]
MTHPQTIALDDAPPQMRPPAVLMQSATLAALQPCRISASRALLVRAIRERWRITRRAFDLDETARGSAFYRIETPDRVFDFPVYSFAFSPKGRTGRIIGRSWDMMAALVEGEMSADDIATTGVELPKLYEGRATPGTLIWCRSNRSSRAFNHTVERLAAGQQPDVATIGQVCYLMRNTGLDGNGTFGTRAFRALEADHPLRTALSAQMLCTYMMRVFAQDLVEHLARCRAPDTAVPLAPEIARYLGVGNGSALGLILFVNNHPQLIDRWLHARETALAAAKSLPVAANDARIGELSRLIARAVRFREQDSVRYDALIPSAQIAAELRGVQQTVQNLFDTGLVEGRRARYPLAALCDHLAPRVAAETLETLHALLIELVPDTADALAETLVVDEETVTQPEMTVGRLRQIVETEYRWALDIDMAAPGAQRFVWYKSVNAEEPRRGPLDEIPWAFNLGLDIPTLAQTLHAALAAFGDTAPVARLLLARPDLRAFIARVQTLSGLPYHSPIMNIMGDGFVPIDMVRLMNVAIHGIDKTRDYLNRNLRGVLYHGAPLPDEIATGTSADWFWPEAPAT